MKKFLEGRRVSEVKIAAASSHSRREYYCVLKKLPPPPLPLTTRNKLLFVYMVVLSLALSRTRVGNSTLERCQASQAKESSFD